MVLQMDKIGMVQSLNMFPLNMDLGWFPSTLTQSNALLRKTFQRYLGNVGMERWRDGEIEGWREGCRD